MEPLLLLVHRMPYPPNKGDKIRSYNLLKFLFKKYRIFLAAFVDSAQDWEYEHKIRELCADICLLPLNPLKAKLHSLRGLLTGQALTLPYYYDDNMKLWIDRVIKKEKIKNVVVFSSAMAQYVCGTLYEELNRIVDFVDVDSDKWRQYSLRKHWPASWLYRRESKYLFDFERQVSCMVSASLFASQEEAEFFKKNVPECTEKIGYYNNGVNTDYFCAERSYPNFYPSDAKILVFTGAMDYWANIDAVIWFVTKVFPLIRRQVKNIIFYIVGSNPCESVRRLAQLQGVYVTGKVDDVRPYLAHADAAVAPLHIARGIQNKVLEAMAMGCPVVASSKAAHGIKAIAEKEILVQDEPSAFADALLRLMSGSLGDRLGDAGRRCILGQYDWSDNLKIVGDLLSSKCLSNYAQQHGDRRT